MGANQSTSAENAHHEAPEVQFDVQCSVPVERVIDIAEEAGRAIMEVYKSDDLGVSSKEDTSPLTRADTESNRIICTRLMQLAPHVPIISEENKLLPHSIRKGFQYTWIVDPLDGTKEFIKRTGEFAVMIGLLQGTQPVLGVVHVPANGKTYFAVLGRGAYVRHHGETKRIEAAEFSPTDSGLVVVASASHMSPETSEFVALLAEPQFKQMGSCLKLLMVAEGLAHIYPRLGPTCEWDTAAADIIVREAGGAVVQAGKVSGSGEMLEAWQDVLLKELPLQYNKEDASFLNPAFVVYGKRPQS